MSQYAHLSEPDPEWAEVACLVPQTELPTDFAQYRKDVAEAVGRSLVHRPLSECIFKFPLGVTVRQELLPVTQTTNNIRTYVPDPDKTLGENQHGYLHLFGYLGKYIHLLLP